MVSKYCFTGCKYSMKVIIVRPLYFHSYLNDNKDVPSAFVKDKVPFYSDDYEELLAHQQTIKSFWEAYSFISAIDEKTKRIKKNNDIRITFELQEIVSSKCN